MNQSTNLTREKQKNKSEDTKLTTKKASVAFNLNEKEIRKRYGDGMIIGARKDGRLIVIPDDTEIIPSKKEIRAFLLQILKQRNNSETVISRGLCPDTKTLNSLLRYLYKRGFIGAYKENNSDGDLIKQIKLTDEGFSYVIGDKHYLSLNAPISLPLAINVNNVNIPIVL